jgi:hypothetical protein
MSANLKSRNIKWRFHCINIVKSQLNIPTFIEMLYSVNMFFWPLLKAIVNKEFISCI